jgi:hypothetical protein
MDSSPFFTDLWVYDPAGRTRAHFHRLGDTPGVTPVEWADVKKQINARGSYGGPAYFQDGRSPRRTMVVLLTRSQGYLAGRMNLYLLSEDLAGLDVGSGGRVFILDASTVSWLIPWKKNRRAFWPRSLRGIEKNPRGEYRAWDGVRVLGVRLPIPRKRSGSPLRDPRLGRADGGRSDPETHPHGPGRSAPLFAGVLALVLGVLVSRSLKEVRGALAKMKEGRFDVLVAVRSGTSSGIWPGPWGKPRWLWRSA